MNDRVILSKIQAQLSSFTSAERKIAEYILEHGDFVPTMTTKQLAEQANASEASIIRFCKRIGLDSFRMLKVALAQELTHSEATINSASLLQTHDTPHSLFQKVTSLNRMSLDMTTKTLSHHEFERAIEVIMNASKVGLYGVGGSFPPAFDGHYKLMRLGFHAVASADYHYMIPFITMMDQTGVVICFSTSGRTKEVIQLASYAKERNLTVIAITTLDNSPLYKLSDIALCIPDIELEQRIGSIASRTSQLNIIDALYVSIFHEIGEDLVESFVESRKKTEERRE
ncbi:MurR/RpiR family transcriptional regulator [Texcoconibacillus texcoconensis]|uniref:DNA-binding MurR/RpiR family transcriptional regulator n=1 Tax=Texcoconibacillus texcoconensis TaxID=1095777 RepID=A0A840QLV3_9BACI|nr:MurR/RpiR family transcriptional regulator [Texcoconibacillus texcoconensis]MBB5172348.1 DNA-binding MurR/RpiR family transcriptional regulator [Texcoconibacillus texcoconensis]